MSFKDLMTYKRILIRHINTSVISRCLTPRSSALLPVRCNPEGDTLRCQQPNYPSQRTTDKRRTTTTNSSSSPHHDSAPSRPHPLICAGAEPIHPVHGPCKLRAWPWPTETRSFFCHFGGSFPGFTLTLLQKDP